VESGTPLPKTEPFIGSSLSLRGYYSSRCRSSYVVMHTEHHGLHVQSIDNQQVLYAAGLSGPDGHILRSDQQRVCSRGIGKPNTARQADNT
jgi:hypothetical protein